MPLSDDELSGSRMIDEHSWSATRRNRKRMARVAAMAGVPRVGRARRLNGRRSFSVP